MKYVSIDAEIGQTVRREVIAFPNDLTHSVVAKHMMAAVQEEYPSARVTLHAAGDIFTQGYQTSGSSGSLGGLKADRDDIRFFNTSDYGGHIL